MEDLKGSINYLPKKEIMVALGFLLQLAEAKDKGGVDTDSVKNFCKFKPAIPIDQAATQIVDITKTNKEFQELYNKQGLFTQEWLRMEGMLSEERQLDRDVIIDVIDAYKNEKAPDEEDTDEDGFDEDGSDLSED